MSPGNNQKLLANYPVIFSYVKYCGVNDGWFNLIDNACRLIMDHLASHPEVPPVVAVQIKEKFGGLRFYYDGGDRHVSHIINDIEDRSYTVCEVCGKPGALLRDRPWMKTLCDEHAK